VIFLVLSVCYAKHGRSLLFFYGGGILTMRAVHQILSVSARGPIKKGEWHHRSFVKSFTVHPGTLQKYFLTMSETHCVPRQQDKPTAQLSTTTRLFVSRSIPKAHASRYI